MESVLEKTGEAWDKFDTFNQVGIVRFEPCKDFDDYELRVKILYRKILDKRGYFIFENLNEEALKFVQKISPSNYRFRSAIGAIFSLTKFLCKFFKNHLHHIVNT